MLKLAEEELLLHLLLYLVVLLSTVEADRCEVAFCTLPAILLFHPGHFLEVQEVLLRSCVIRIELVQTVRHLTIEVVYAGTHRAIIASIGNIVRVALVLALPCGRLAVATPIHFTSLHHVVVISRI